jgi:hypothetical protein
MGPGMRSFVIDDGRLFALKLSDWLVLLGGTALCGLFALMSI